MYLDKEQLKEVIYLLLNRAVRYYGDIHDVLLDIIQILSGQFQEMKKIRNFGTMLAVNHLLCNDYIKLVCIEFRKQFKDFKISIYRKKTFVCHILISVI